jgi:hypothetical protein
VKDAWLRFWQCKDRGFIIAAAISGNTASALIGAWALQDHNVLALVLTLLGIAFTDAAYRTMGIEIDEGDGHFGADAITFAILSWVLPIAAVALLVFFPPPPWWMHER